MSKLAHAAAWATGLGKAAALSAGTLVWRRTKAPTRIRRGDVRVSFLTEGDPRHHPTPAARYRALQYLPLLESAGDIRCRALPSKPGKYEWVSAKWERRRAKWPRLGSLGTKVILGRQALRRAWHFLRCAHDDVLVLQRELLAAPELTLARYAPIFNARIVFDMDDALWRLPAWAPASEHERIGARLERKIATLCGLAAACTVANEYLADFARRYCDRVLVVPTCLDTEHFTPGVAVAKTTQDIPTIGWAGTSGNLHYLTKILPALQALEKRRRFRLRVVCDAFPEELQRGLAPGCVDYLPWTSQHEVERLRSFDIGIMPLDDDPWARGKAGFKLIQYMACGVPCVWSPVGANVTVAGAARDGIGFAASEQGDWTAALDRLLADPELRARAGRAARARATLHYDCKVWAPRLAELYRDVARDA